MRQRRIRTVSGNDRREDLIWSETCDLTHTQEDFNLEGYFWAGACGFMSPAEMIRTNKNDGQGYLSFLWKEQYRCQVVWHVCVTIEWRLRNSEHWARLMFGPPLDRDKKRRDRLNKTEGAKQFCSHFTLWEVGNFIFVGEDYRYFLKCLPWNCSFIIIIFFL